MIKNTNLYKGEPRIRVNKEQPKIPDVSAQKDFQDYKNLKAVIRKKAGKLAAFSNDLDQRIQQTLINSPALTKVLTNLDQQLKQSLNNIIYSGSQVPAKLQLSILSSLNYANSQVKMPSKTDFLKELENRKNTLIKWRSNAMALDIKKSKGENNVNEMPPKPHFNDSEYLQVAAVDLLRSLASFSKSIDKTLAELKQVDKYKYQPPVRAASRPAVVKKYEESFVELAKSQLNNKKHSPKYKEDLVHNIFKKADFFSELKTMNNNYLALSKNDQELVSYMTGLAQNLVPVIQENLEILDLKSFKTASF
jgi:hypothetical protein